MFRPMRRNDKALSEQETLELLRICPSGVLAVLGDDGYPYTVPVNYVYDEEDRRIYFHCAKEGHKLDAIRRCDKVSFCVVGQDKVVQQEFNTHFRSAIVFGRARIVEDDVRRRHALRCFNRKLSPDYPEQGEWEIETSWERVCLVEIEPEHITGKGVPKE
ncbi:MAG: pyridoxamine 5'-phosphate oxidase family protein [Clostridia bacterium]|nr:pyridoxamine 5'-phosphate oxidase family protein [Clostridia bacterium]